MARRARSIALPREEGESYFVSLNDLLVGMLFVFIILLMIFALSYQSAEVRLTKRIERLEDELSGREDMRRKLLERLRAELRKSGVEAKIDEKNGVLHLPEKLLFASGSSELGAEGRAALANLARTLSAELPCYGYAAHLEQRQCDDDTDAILEAVYVEGHTDNVPIYTARYRSNWALSSDRAIQTYQYMVGTAPSLATIRNAAGSATMFGVSAYADQRPVRPNANATEAGRAENRRIDIRFLISAPTKGDLDVKKGVVGDFLKSL